MPDFWEQNTRVIRASGWIVNFAVVSNRSIPVLLLLLVMAIAGFAGAPVKSVNALPANTGPLGIIKGIVRDDSGSPIGDATVAIFRTGTSKLLKQVTSSSDGSFLAKIMPGKYTVLAVAQGFNPTYLFGVEVARAAEINYGFKLERAGGGDTLPEKRVDRNSSKWRIRGAQAERSIYQHQEGESPIEEDIAAADTAREEARSSNRPQTTVETYFAGTDRGSFTGVNFATLLPVNDKAQVIITGQTGTGKIAPQRFEVDLRLRPSGDHVYRFNSSAGFLGNVTTQDKERALGQLSFQALDEWKIRDGIILIFGVDYSQFVGAGGDFSLSPRLGLQFDIDSKTRLRTAFTTQTEEKSWARSVDLEGESIAFSEPVSIDDFVVENGKPQMNKSRRLEFGVERVLDNRSSVEANVFFDTTLARGVGLNSLPFDTLGGDGFAEFVANQQGQSRGVRVVYTRRLNEVFTATGGYSAGSGQQLSPAAITDPLHIFESDFFQSFFGQLAADLGSGTSVKTIFRLSPEAAVFAIDPFKGRLAIYDPGLSVLVTQHLPTFGLPLRADAIVDARNVFDFQSLVSGDEGTLKITGRQRTLRGGIQVRF